jgi:hypothetical protein
MKRIKTLSNLVAVSLLGIAMLVATSCGSSKTSQSDLMMMQMMQMMQQQQQQQNYQNQYSNQASGLGREVAKSPAQFAAEDPNATQARAWGSYNGFPDDDLEYAATNIARGKLSESLSIWVQTAFSNFVDRMTKEGLTSDGMAQKKVRDENTTNKIKNVSENLIQGSKVIVSNRYRQANGTETAYVCVELDPQIVINKMKNDASIINAITDDEQLKIKIKSHMFDKEMADTFDQYRAAQEKMQQ